MSADEIVEYYQYIEKEGLPEWEFYVKVECWIDPGQNGATGRYGEPLEPSYGPHVEDYNPVEMRFASSETWHDFDYFTEKWDLKDDIEFDTDKLLELCNDKNEPHFI